MRLALAPLLSLLPILGVSAQAVGSPTVFLTIYGGVVAGPQLWRVSQPLCVWMTVPGGYQCELGPSGAVNDTLALTRRVSTGLSAGIGLAKFFGTRLGGRVDVWFSHESVQDWCAPLSGFQPDSDRKNLQTCDNFTADQGSIDLVGASASLLVRPLPEAAISPYLRAGAGLTIESGETLAASGAFTANGITLDRPLVRDSSGGSLRPSGLLAIGLQAGMGVTSRVQLEFADLLIPLSRLSGPADAAGRAARTTGVTHHLSVSLGIAWVFSGRRGRRY